MKEQVAANSPAREGQVSNLIEMMQKCFNINRTRFFTLVSFGALVKISPGIAAVTPPRMTTQFWTVLSKLGKAVGNIESLCGKQFALALWICQTRCLVQGQEEGLPLWKQWLSAFKWKEQDENWKRCLTQHSLRNCMTARTLCDLTVKVLLRWHFGNSANF